MKEVLADTNVLVSFLTDRDPAQRKRSRGLFRSAAAGECALILHQAALTELVYVLRHVYQVDPAEISTLLHELLALPGITTVDRLSWERVLDLWPESVGDFGDAVLAAVALDCKPDAVATFDRRFRRQLASLEVPAYW